MSKPTLYQFSYSMSCEKVRRVLKQKGVEWDTVEVGWFDRSPVKELTNQHLVPVFKHGDKVLGPASIEVIDYIEDTFDGPTVYPGNSRGISHILNEYDEKVLFGMGCQVFFPAAASVMSNADFDADVKRLMGKTPEELWADLPNVAEQYKAHLTNWNDHLANSPWFAGNELSAADHIIYSNFWFATNNPKFAEMEAGMGFKHLDAWFAKMKEWMWNAPM